MRAGETRQRHPGRQLHAEVRKDRVPSHVLAEHRGDLRLQRCGRGVARRRGGRLLERAQFRLQLLRRGLRLDALGVRARLIAVRKIRRADGCDRGNRRADHDAPIHPLAHLGRRAAIAGQQIDDDTNVRAAECEPDRRRQIRLEARKLVGREADVADSEQVVHVRRLDGHSDQSRQPLGEPGKLRRPAGDDDAQQLRRPRLVAVVVD